MHKEIWNQTITFHILITSCVLHCIMHITPFQNKCWFNPTQGSDENYTRWTMEEYDKVGGVKNGSVSLKHDVIATTWKDGPYLLVVVIKSNKQEANWNLTGGFTTLTPMHLNWVVVIRHQTEEYRLKQGGTTRTNKRIDCNGKALAGLCNIFTVIYPNEHDPVIEYLEC